MNTTIVTCTCLNDFQDKKYGKNKRVANPMKDSNKYRCTVCKKEHQVNKKEEK